MSSNTNFGASIVADANKGPTTTTLDSPALTPAVSREDLPRDYENKPIPPHSPFYQHPPASFEKIHSRANSRTNVNAAPDEKDLELGAATPLAPSDDHPFASRVDVDCSKECRMWPSKQTLQQQSQTRKRQKRGTKTLGRITSPAVDFWHRSTKRQRLYMKIALGFVLIGVVVAIAVGITAAVNGTVYVGENRSQELPDPDQQ